MIRNVSKRLILVGLLTASATTGWTQNEVVTNSFDLDRCVQYGLEHNQSVLNKALDKEIAETKAGETLSRGLPQVNINGGVNYNYEVQTSLIDASNFDPSAVKGTEVPISFGQAYDGNLKLTVRQLIFDGSFFVGMQAARVFRDLSAKDHTKTKIDVTVAVTKAYYNLLITSERLEMAEASFSRLDSLLKDTKVLYQNGFIEKIDVSRVKVQLNNLTVERNRLRQFAKISNDLLKFQMGMPLTDILEIQQNINSITFSQVEETISDFNYENRIEYSQLQTNKLLVELDMKSNKMQYIPTLYADFKYGYNTATTQSEKMFDTGRWFNYGTLGISLTIPVFDGFLKRSRIQKNKIQLQQLQNSIQMTGNSIDLETRQSKINLNSAIDKMSAQKENMRLADEIFKVSKIKYQEGVGSNSEVLDADKALKQSQTNYYNALFDALVAKIDLQKAYGTLLNIE